MNGKIRNYGLKPPKRSRKNYSHSKTFGSFPISQLPEEYLLVSSILDQGPTFKCTAYTASAIQESQEDISFDPDWFFEQEGITNGKKNETGYGIDTQMKTGVTAGFKPLAGGEPKEHKDDSYFEIDGGYDLFDNIRVAMWLGKDEKRCASLGTRWYSEWGSGMIPLLYKTLAGYHNIKCAGWKEIGGETYLVIQNSYGKDFGDNGLNYFPRSIVNKEFKLGTFCWRKTPDPEQIKKIGLLVSLLQQLVDLYRKIIDKFLLKKTEEPITPIDEEIPPPAPEQAGSRIEAWAKAIQKEEGWFLGSRAYKNNNPGNLKYGSFTMNLPFRGIDADNFLLFDTYEQGFAALCGFLRNACEGRYAPAYEPTMTLFEFTRKYAEPPSNAYALNIAKALKVAPIIEIAKLL